MMRPLPKLYARNLGRRGVLHEVVERDAAVAADPGRRVGEAGGNVGADAGVSDLAWHLGVEQVAGGDLDILAQDVVLGWT